MTNNTNYAALSMDEIIFIDRNQNYGAFDIRKSYPDHIKRSIIAMLTIVTSLFSYQELSAYIHPFRKMAADKEITCKLVDMPIDKPNIVKPPVAEPPKGSPNVATASFAEMVAGSHDADSLTPVDQLSPDLAFDNHAAAGDPGRIGDPAGSEVIEMHVAAPPKEPEIREFAEEMPEYPGGEEALVRFLSKTTEYPEIDKEMDRQGTVMVGLVIDENGKVTNTQILKSASSTMDREALRVVGLLKAFKPGRQAGQPVKVRYRLPIRYRLSEQ